MIHLDVDKKIKIFAALEWAIIIVLAIIPLFVAFPYRVNIFLSWEGAYRLSQGQVPYYDFGMPLGYMYWVIPALFFKIFGVQMITLVKAQVFINIISGLAFRSILKSLSVQPGVRLISVLLYCISFSFFNFWPWYNHTVIVYEMIALAFLFRYTMKSGHSWWLLALSALFTFCSFFTKQDGGGLAFVLSLTLLVAYCLIEKRWKPLGIYLLAIAVVGIAIIAPLTQFNFGYWFNRGQPPHTARISVFEIVDEFFAASKWIKFYLLLLLLLAIATWKKGRQVFFEKRHLMFLLLTLGILTEATILQVTSYTPPDNNIFFHSFAFAFILCYLALYLNLNFFKLKTLIMIGAAVLLWWSGSFWKYFQRIAQRTLVSNAQPNTNGENIVNRNTYLLHQPTGEIPMSQWKFSSLPVFEKIYMPAPTIDGIERLLQMPIVRSGKNLKVLNMTELTPLAAAIPYQLEKGPNIPLWYHLGVSMFNRQAQAYEQKIAHHYYDLVLFEYVPSLNNFYPFRVRDSLAIHYNKIDSFPAPRQGNTQGMIEVYTVPLHPNTLNPSTTKH